MASKLLLAGILASCIIAVYSQKPTVLQGYFVVANSTNSSQNGRYQPNNYIGQPNNNYGQPPLNYNQQPNNNYGQQSVYNNQPPNNYNAQQPGYNSQPPVVISAGANNYGWNLSNSQKTKYPNQFMNIGVRQPGDVSLLKTLVTKDGSWYQAKAKKDITFPDPMSKIKVRSITQVSMMNNNPVKGDQGVISITKGGIGQNNVVIHCKSAPGRPLDMTLEVFGFPN